MLRAVCFFDVLKKNLDAQRRVLLQRFSSAFSLSSIFASSTLNVELISAAATFLFVLLLRDPHCGGVVRGTGPHHHKHIERMRVAYTQDATRVTITHNKTLLLIT
jgi:hypothetical protein